MQYNETEIYVHLNESNEFVYSDESLDFGENKRVIGENTTVHRVYVPTPDNVTECPHNCTFGYTGTYTYDSELDKVVENYDLELKEGESLELAIVETSRQVREARDELLRESDPIVFKSIESNSSVPTEWSTYRQALRDLPSHGDFPFIVDSDWPTPPE